MPRLLPLAAALVALSACQDPAGVGLGLIDEEGSDPATRTVTATSADTLRDARPLIGFADSSASLSQTRVLVGDVVDPVFGDARAVAYLDLVRPAIPDDPGDVLVARLELQRTYVYGDTTTTLPLALRQVEGRWSPTLDYPADTTLAAGPVLASSSVSVADGVVAFDLPASWIEANGAALFAADFNEAFEGFAVEPAARPAPGAVFGFQVASRQTRLRVETTTDTLFYAVGEVFTSLARQALAGTPTRFVPAQVGAGRGVRLRFPLGDVGPLPLARAVFEAPVETALAQDGPFVRPLADRALLYGIDGEGARRLLGLVSVRDGVATTAQTLILSEIQGGLLGTVRFESFELVPGASLGAVQGTTATPASLDVLPVLRPGGAEAAPRFRLTVVGGS